MYTLKSPFVKFTATFDKFFDAVDYAKNCVKKHNGIKFIVIIKDNNIIDTVVKPGYLKYDFATFKLFDQHNMIADYFLLKIDNKRHYLIKTKNL